MSATPLGPARVRAAGRGTCAAGESPGPPLDGYPLLCWAADHPRFGAGAVFLEDGSASVRDVATAAAGCPSPAAVAARLGTTAAHVDQAIRYAVACGYPSR